MSVLLPRLESLKHIHVALSTRNQAQEFFLVLPQLRTDHLETLHIKLASTFDYNEEIAAFGTEGISKAIESGSRGFGRLTSFSFDGWVAGVPSMASIFAKMPNLTHVVLCKGFSQASEKQEDDTTVLENLAKNCRNLVSVCLAYAPMYSRKSMYTFEVVCVYV